MIIYFLLKIFHFFNKYCGEDEYQKSRFLQEKSLPYIYSEITLKKNIENIYEKIQLSLSEYFRYKEPVLEKPILLSQNKLKSTLLSKKKPNRAFILVYSSFSK